MKDTLARYRRANRTTVLATKKKLLLSCFLMEKIFSSSFWYDWLKKSLRNCENSRFLNVLRSYLNVRIPLHRHFLRESGPGFWFGPSESLL